MSDDKKLFSSYEDLVKHLSENKLEGYSDLQNIEQGNLDELIGKRYNTPKLGNKSDDVQNLLNNILEQDYPALNKARNIVGQPDLAATYGNIRGGAYINMPKKGYDTDIFLGPSSMSTLSHEIGHANDDIGGVMKRVMEHGDTKEADRVMNLLVKDNSPDMKQFLWDLDNMNTSIPTTSSALKYDRPKLESHLELLSKNEPLSRELKGVKKQIEGALARGLDRENLEMPFRKNDNILQDHIKDWENHFMPMSDNGRYQYGTDFGLNKQISDLVPDNSILTSNSDNHHTPRVDEVTGKMDKGNWERRNLKRLWLGKGLKALPWIGAGASLLAGDAASAASIFDPTDPGTTGMEADMTDSIRAAYNNPNSPESRKRAKALEENKPLLLRRPQEQTENKLLMKRE